MTTLAGQWIYFLCPWAMLSCGMFFIVAAQLQSPFGKRGSLVLGDNHFVYRFQMYGASEFCFSWSDYQFGEKASHDNIDLVTPVDKKPIMARAYYTDKPDPPYFGLKSLRRFGFNKIFNLDIMTYGSTLPAQRGIVEHHKEIDMSVSIVGLRYLGMALSIGGIAILILRLARKSHGGCRRGFAVHPI